MTLVRGFDSYTIIIYSANASSCMVTVAFVLVAMFQFCCGSVGPNCSVHPFWNFSDCVVLYALSSKAFMPRLHETNAVAVIMPTATMV